MSFIDELKYTTYNHYENKRVWTVYATRSILTADDSLCLSRIITKGLIESGYMKAENTSIKNGYRENFCHIDRSMPTIILEHRQSFQTNKFKCLINLKEYKREDIPMLFDYIRLEWFQKNP